MADDTSVPISQAEEVTAHCLSPLHGLPEADLHGFARHLERRPEYLFRNLVPDVIDAAPIPKWEIQGIQVFAISELFAGNNEIFLGFGKPNVYLTVPDGNGGYEKFAGLSLKRGPSTIQDTKGRVQSGILIRFVNLPAHAAEKLREAMQKHHGKRYWTCVNVVLRILEDAGFASGKKPLSSYYFPYQCLRTLLRQGLTFEGQPVSFEVIRTAPDSIEQHTWGITEAEATTACRHAEHSLHRKAKQSKFYSALEKLQQLPSKLASYLMPRPKAPPTVPAVVAPPPACNKPCPSDLQIRVSNDSLTGMLLRQLWGPHSLFEARQTRVDVDRYLPEKLHAFPQKNPTALTRLKKTLLFSRPVVKAIRGVLSPRYADLGCRSSLDIYTMLRTHSETNPNKYNLVITGNRIILARTSVAVRAVDWVLTKHVLMSGYDPDVRFSGEVWKDAQGTLVVNRNSGTYQPTDQQLDQARDFLAAVLAPLTIDKEDQPLDLINFADSNK